MMHGVRRLALLTTCLVCSKLTWTKAAMQNSVIVITGASQGIGAAAATHLAQQGARVVLAARSEGKIAALAQELSSMGMSATAVPCDVSDATQVK